MNELKHSFRQLVLRPGFSATVIVMLALGIGANTAIFSVVNAVLLKPIPFSEPDRLVQLMNTTDGTPDNPYASPAKFMHWRAQTEVLEDVAGFYNRPVTYSAGGLPEQVIASDVTEAFFRVFHAPIALGRAFAPQDDLPGAPKTAVIGYDFWTQRLGADPGIVGKTLSLSGTPHTVIGVAGKDFEFREPFGQPEVWTPLQLDPDTPNQGQYFVAVGRLKKGVTLEQAQAQLQASVKAFQDRFPIARAERSGFTAVSLQTAIVGRDVRTTFGVLLGAVGFVLLIACTNVASLLLVRAIGRRREIAIRAALGSSRARIVRQLLTESLLLSIAGGALGLAAGFIGIRALLAVSTAGLPRLGEAGSLLGMDWRVVTFTVAVSLTTGLLFGLAPALAGSRVDLNSVIKDASGRSGSGYRENRTRSALVTLELGLAVVLLIGAALLIRTSWALSRVDPGFNTTQVLTMRTAMSGQRFETTASVEGTARVALERLRALPGVAAATATCCVPLTPGYALGFSIVGRDNGSQPFSGSTNLVITSSGYFEAFEIPVIRGRAFTDRDDASAVPVIVINEALAKQHWPDGSNPIGERVQIGGGAAHMQPLADEPRRQVIGVVANTRAAGLVRGSRPYAYVPQAQLPDALSAFNVTQTPMAWVVRTRGDPSGAAAAVRDELRAATGLPVTDVQPLSDIASASVSRQRLNMLLMSAFGGVALLLAAIGLYGLVAYSVEQRTHEIGIRLALGAETTEVRNMVLRQSVPLIVIGVGAGLIAAFFLAKLLAAVLFGVEPHDALVFVGVPVALASIALFAAAVAARRATRVKPIAALRYE